MTLEQDSWERPYRVVRAKMTRSGPPESHSRGRVARILDDLFVTGRGKQLEEEHGARIPWTQNKYLYDLRAMEEDPWIAMKWCDPKKAASVEGVPGQVVKIIVEQCLGGFNGIHRSGRIPAVWNVARVVLLSKPARDPLLSSPYRPISILPALSKVWEHTCKIHIERCLGRDPFHREQYGFKRGSSTIDALRRVCGIAERCKKEVVNVLATLDIKNAFNTARWRRILEEAKKRRLPGQLLNILGCSGT